MVTLEASRPHADWWYGVKNDRQGSGFIYLVRVTFMVPKVKENIRRAAALSCGICCCQSLLEDGRNIVVGRTLQVSRRATKDSSLDIYVAVSAPSLSSGGLLST